MIAVVHDTPDAKSYRRYRPSRRALLALTPNARAALTGTDLPAIRARDCFNDWHPARTVVSGCRSSA